VDENVVGIEVRFDVADGLLEVFVVRVPLTIKKALDDWGVTDSGLEAMSFDS
jgi:hypothetical protein